MMSVRAVLIDIKNFTNTAHLFFGPCIFNNEDKNKPTKCIN